MYFQYKSLIGFNHLFFKGLRRLRHIKVIDFPRWPQKCWHWHLSMTDGNLATLLIPVSCLHVHSTNIIITFCKGALFVVNHRYWEEMFALVNILLVIQPSLIIRIRNWSLLQSRKRFQFITVTICQKCYLFWYCTN